MHLYVIAISVETHSESMFSDVKSDGRKDGIVCEVAADAEIFVVHIWESGDMQTMGDAS